MQHPLCSELPSILFRDHKGYWRPLNHLYWSQSSQQLVARHPNSTVEETISHYCPQCLTRYSDEEVKQNINRCPSCVQCPCCESPLTVVSNILACGFCLWSHPLEPEKGDFEKASDTAKSAFQNLLLNFNSMENAVNPSITRSYDHIFSKSKKRDLNDDNTSHSSALEKNTAASNPFLFEYYEVRSSLLPKAGELSSDFEGISVAQRLRDPSAPTSYSHHGLYPVRTPLLTKRTLRSRSDLEAGRMNILIQPKSFPLEGDSSLKIQRGKWWPKDSSAILQLPSVSILHLPDLQTLLRGRGSELLLRLTNPKETEQSVHFSPLAKRPRKTSVDDNSSLSGVGGREEDEEVEESVTGSPRGKAPEMMVGHDLAETSIGDWDDAEGAELRFTERGKGASVSVLRLSTNPLPPSGLHVALAGYEDELLRDEEEDAGEGGAFVTPQAGWSVLQKRHVALLKLSVKLSDKQRNKVKADEDGQGDNLLFELRLQAQVVAEKHPPFSLPMRIFFLLSKAAP